MHKIAIALLMAASLGACSHLNTTAADAAAIDCAKVDLGTTVESAGMSVLMTVAGILFDGGANWQSDLAQIGGKYGPEALACAEKYAAALFKPAPNSTPATGDAVETPYDRALKSLSGKSFK